MRALSIANDGQDARRRWAWAQRTGSWRTKLVLVCLATLGGVVSEERIAKWCNLELGTVAVALETLRVLALVAAVEPGWTLRES